VAVETRSFAQRLRAAQEAQDSLLCVGLDPDTARFPDGVARSPEAVAGFNRAIIEATADLACCYKPNMGFYLQYGIPGVEALAACATTSRPTSRCCWTPSSATSR